MLRLFLPVFALLALGSCGKPAPVADADPALWVVKDADTTIYLFGTVHALKPGLGWFDDAVRSAFDKSDSLVLELVMPPDDEMQAIVQELGANDASLSSQLPPETAMKLHDALARAGKPADALDGSEAWLAAIQIAANARPTGYDPKDGAEAVLSAAAGKAGKPVTGLETAREQFGYFDGLSVGAQQTLLAQTLDELPDAETRLDGIVAAWGRGDVAAIGALLNKDLARSPELERALLIRRNQHWADWISARMKTPGTVFVAVGAGHLAGPHGLQGDLMRRGIRVFRIRY